MRVKFTNSLNVKEVIFGTVTEMYNQEMLLIQADKGGLYAINPNSDYNFRFIPNEEADNKFQEALNKKVDELDALEKKSKKS
jgi:hypothetical protein